MQNAGTVHMQSSFARRRNCGEVTGVEVESGHLAALRILVEMGVNLRNS